jgi:hypothetical protein
LEGHTGGTAKPETQDQELAALQQQLSALLAVTPQHPDVIR